MLMMIDSNSDVLGKRSRWAMAKDQPKANHLDLNQGEGEDSAKARIRMRMHPYRYTRIQSNDDGITIGGQSESSSSKQSRWKPNLKTEEEEDGRSEGKVNVYVKSTFRYSPKAPENYTQFIIGDQMCCGGIHTTNSLTNHLTSAEDQDVDLITFLKTQFETDFTGAAVTEQSEAHKVERKKHRRGKKKASVSGIGYATELHGMKVELGRAPENYTQFIIGDQMNQISLPVDTDLTTFLQTQFENDFQSARSIELGKKSKAELADLIYKLEYRKSELQNSVKSEQSELH